MQRNSNFLNKFFKTAKSLIKYLKNFESNLCMCTIHVYYSKQKVKTKPNNKKKEEFFQ